MLFLTYYGNLYFVNLRLPEIVVGTLNKLYRFLRIETLELTLNSLFIRFLCVRKLKRDNVHENSHPAN